MPRDQFRSALPLAEPPHGQGAPPPANIARPCRRYTPAARARLRNRQGMVRSARPADAPASWMPRSRSPAYSSPFVIGRWRPIRRRRGTVLLWRERSLQFTEKTPTPARQLPITGSAHKTGIVGDPLVRTVLAALDVAAERGGATGFDRRHDLQLGGADVTGVGLSPRRPVSAKDVGDPRTAIRGPLHATVRRAAFSSSA